MKKKTSLALSRRLVCRAISVILLLPAIWGALAAQRRTSELELAGKVILAGGQSLPEPARIELSCKGNVQVLGYTDPDGLFNFRVSDQLPALDDPTRMGPGISTQANRASRRYYNLDGCELTANLKGYTSVPIRLTRRSRFEGSNVGQIMLQPESVSAEDESGDVVSVQALAVPRKAQKAYSKAVAEMSLPNPDLKVVLRHLKEALTIHPQFTEAWILVGKTHARNGNTGAARDAFLLALRSDPGSMSALLSLCLADLKLNRAQEAVELADQALEQDPRLVEAHFYAGLARVALGHLAAAEKHLLFVSKSQECSHFPRTYYLLGDIYYQQGELQRAAEEYRRYLEVEQGSQAAGLARQRLAELPSGALP